MTYKRHTLYKKCNKCGEEKPLTSEYFHYSDRKRGYFKGQCAVCVRKRHNEYYQHGRKRSEQQKQRLKLVAKIRRDAQKELIKRHKTEYELIYATLLKKADLELKRYEGVQFERHEEEVR